MTTVRNDEAIVIRGARQHNLKDISVSIPRDQLVVITGLSGSGKSSLAFDTIFAEGQRRYVESLSSYAKQFLALSEKPEVESIEGLSPTVAIQQKTTSHNPRSTVGTVTEIYDYLRLLFARVAKPFCRDCEKPISSQTNQQIVDLLISLPEGTKLTLLAPLARKKKGEFQKELETLRQKGFSKVRIDGEILDLSQDFLLDKNIRHDIDVFIDRLVIRSGESLRQRIQESIETSFRIVPGLIRSETELKGQTENLLHSTSLGCPDCGVSYPPPEPRTFSFNSPIGACPDCEGIGFSNWDEHFSLDTEEGDTSAPIQERLKPCSTCLGTRLKKDSLYFKLSNESIATLGSWSLDRVQDFFDKLQLTTRELQIADRVLHEIRERVRFLNQVGVSYLSLDRPAQTLSGGESQRIRLATQIGSALTGVIYVLDEPSIGLHQRDNERLLDSLLHLRNKGNTVLVVEHDQETMERADYILDLGPGAGRHGGQIIAQGSFSEICSAEGSLTGMYLSGIRRIEVPKSRRKPQGWISVEGAKQNNLRNITAKFPLGVLCCVTGVSGSGKSTLVLDTLYPAAKLSLDGTLKAAEIRSRFLCEKISGLEAIDKIIDIDQSPIGRTPRSNPATYTGLFDVIRTLFASTPQARSRGFKPGRFSFNVKGGRCETCQGGGMVRVEMHFLSDLFVPCQDCQGLRYHGETLQIRYKNRNIAEVLAMTMDEAKDFFSSVPSLAGKLGTLSEVGLGYLTLGQSATTLSGGEAQRLKLATELSRKATGKTLYILDEPSTGLHFEDVRKLIELMDRLVEQGNTVIVIEHSMDIIKCADYLIDLGPEGGKGGGQILAHGTPEFVAKEPSSITGRFIAKYV